MILTKCAEIRARKANMMVKWVLFLNHQMHVSTRSMVHFKYGNHDVITTNYDFIIVCEMWFSCFVKCDFPRTLGSYSFRIEIVLYISFSICSLHLNPNQLNWTISQSNNGLIVFSANLSSHSSRLCRVLCTLYKFFYCSKIVFRLDDNLSWWLSFSN